MPAGVVFAVALLVVAAAAGWRPGRPTLAAAGLGALGGGALVGAWLLSHGGPGVHRRSSRLRARALDSCRRADRGRRGGRAPRRAVQRGALLGGDGGALLVTTLLFAAMHVPLYGIGSLPLDLAAGLLLGGLRIVSGGVLAPAVAHVVADLAGGWLL